MRATIATGLSIWEWARYIGINPFYVAQIGTNVPRAAPVQNDKCDAVMFQHAFQQFDHLSREEIADSISHAEQLFFENIGYWPAPMYVSEEIRNYPKHYNLHAVYTTGRATQSGFLPMGNVSSLRGSDERFKAVRLKGGWIQSIGTRNSTLVEAGAAVVLSDTDSDSVKDRFTITVTVVAGTLASEIEAEFITADRGVLTREEAGAIRPLEVSITGTTATITGWIMLLVKPTLQEALAADTLDAETDANYAATVDIYRVVTDGTDTGNLIWENLYPCNQSDPCLSIAQTACFQARDLERGFIAPVPALYNSDITQFLAQYPTIGYREPDRVAVNYLSGFARQSNGQMDRNHARIIALLATALLPNKTCGCDRANQRLEYYRDMPKDKQGNSEVTETMLDNPFGTGRGAIEAWGLAERLMQYGSPQGG